MNFCRTPEIMDILYTVLQKSQSCINIYFSGGTQLLVVSVNRFLISDNYFSHNQ